MSHRVLEVLEVSKLLFCLYVETACALTDARMLWEGCLVCLVFLC